MQSGVVINIYVEAQEVQEVFLFMKSMRIGMVLGSMVGGEIRKPLDLLWIQNLIP